MGRPGYSAGLSPGGSASGTQAKTDKDISLYSKNGITRNQDYKNVAIPVFFANLQAENTGLTSAWFFL